MNGLSPFDSSFQHALCESDRARIDALIAALGRGTIAEQDAARWERFYLAAFDKSMGGDPAHSAMRADLMMAEWRKRFAPTIPPCHHCGEPSDPSTRGVRNALRRDAEGTIEVEYWVCNSCGASTSRDVKPTDESSSPNHDVDESERPTDGTRGEVVFASGTCEPNKVPIKTILVGR